MFKIQPELWFVDIIPRLTVRARMQCICSHATWWLCLRHRTRCRVDAPQKLNTLANSIRLTPFTRTLRRTCNRLHEFIAISPSRDQDRRALMLSYTYARRTKAGCTSLVSPGHWLWYITCGGPFSIYFELKLTSTRNTVHWTFAFTLIDRNIGWDDQAY